MNNLRTGFNIFRKLSNFLFLPLQLEVDVLNPVIGSFELAPELCDVLREHSSLSREGLRDLLLEVHWGVSFEDVGLQFRDLSADVVEEHELLANRGPVLSDLIDDRLQGVVE